MNYPVQFLRRQGVARCAALAMLAGFLLVWNSREPMGCVSSLACDDGEQSKPPCLPPPKWELLGFWDAETNERIEITKLRIVLPRKKDTPFQVGFTGDETVVNETTDPVVLRAMRDGFLNWPFRVAVPEGTHGACGSWYSLGEVKVTTTKGQFLIGVTNGGFALGSRYLSLQNAFYSWGLAKYIDDVLFDKTKLRIPSDVFRGLSGESRILGEKHLYREIRKKMKAR